MQKFKLILLICSTLVFASCATIETNRSEEPPKTVNVVLPPAEPTMVVEKVTPPAAETADISVKIKPAPVTHTEVHAHKEIEGVSPQQALKWLKNGNRRFTKGFFRNDGATQKDVERLSKGQKPHSIVLSCSDSRVPPEVVFDQKLGEIFVVRTAGETLDAMAIASIEYAVEHLGSHNIVVMGHSQCGAVKAALGTMAGQDAGSPSLNKLVADIHPRISQFANKTPSQNYVDEGWANTKGVVKDLLERSAIVAEKVKSGEVEINSALYHLDSGKAEFSN